MDFIEELNQFSDRIIKLKDNLKTEEATKTSLVLPFFKILGYDIFNPFEFVPEFTADTGTKKGEKVDYAIMKNGEPVMIIEVKPCDIDLNTKHINQLFRYFTVTKAKFGILTNGIIYRFFSDLEETNKMDLAPFLEVNLLDIREDIINELKRFRKEMFDMKGILDSASELKYTAMIKKVLADQFQEPSDQFVKAIISKGVYSGIKTQAVLDKFRDMVKIAFNEYVNDIISDKIKTAISNPTQQVQEKSQKVVEFTSEEIDILDYVKGIVGDPDDIIYKKTSSYISLQLGDNIRRWICRIYIKQKDKTFILHKYDNTDYEHEYYFEEASQLEQIKDIILEVYNLCKHL